MYTTQFLKNLSKLHNSCWIVSNLNLVPNLNLVSNQPTFWADFRFGPHFFFSWMRSLKSKNRSHFSSDHNLTNKIAYVANEVHLDTLNPKVAAKIILKFFI